MKAECYLKHTGRNVFISNIFVAESYLVTNPTSLSCWRQPMRAIP